MSDSHKVQQEILEVIGRNDTGTFMVVFIHREADGRPTGSINIKIKDQEDLGIVLEVSISHLIELLASSCKLPVAAASGAIHSMVDYLSAALEDSETKQEVVEGMLMGMMNPDKDTPSA